MEFKHPSLIFMYSIEQITQKQAEKLLSKYHYLGKKSFRQSIIFGIVPTNRSFGDSTIYGACVFHLVSAPETCVGAFGLERADQEGIFELGRLVMHPSLNGGNHTSWFVSRTIRLLKIKYDVRAIISYADSSAGHIGSIYRACNALYCGTTEPKNDFYVNGKIQERGKTKDVVGEWKPRPIKHRYVWLFDKSLKLLWPVEKHNEKGIPNWMKENITISNRHI
jgi:hypothetical protein